MTIHPTADPAMLRAELLARLARVAPGREGGFTQRGQHLFSYCCLQRERIAAVRMPHPVIAIVLRGAKEVWLGDTCEVLPAGSVFCLPRDVPLDVVNIPDARLSLYESLLLEIAAPPESVPPLGRTERQTAAAPGRFTVPLSRDLVHALAHAATALIDESHREAIGQLRVAEVLTLLRGCPQARPLFARSLAEEAMWLVRAAPSEAWSVSRLAEALGLAPSTLRRRLVAEGQPFRGIVAQARMAAARASLDTGSSANEAAVAAGYASRSHFSRRFRQAFGTTPTGRT